MPAGNHGVYGRGLSTACLPGDGSRHCVITSESHMRSAVIEPGCIDFAPPGYDPRGILKITEYDTELPDEQKAAEMKNLADLHTSMSGKTYQLSIEITTLWRMQRCRRAKRSMNRIRNMADEGRRTEPSLRRGSLYLLAQQVACSGRSERRLDCYVRRTRTIFRPRPCFCSQTDVLLQ
jgi:hypothetical protein